MRAHRGHSATSEGESTVEHPCPDCGVVVDEVGYQWFKCPECAMRWTLAELESESGVVRDA